MYVYILYYAAVKFMLACTYCYLLGKTWLILLLLERQMGKVGNYYKALVIIKIELKSKVHWPAKII